MNEMRTAALSLTLALTALIAACGPDDGAQPVTFAVEGYVHAGPTCPVVTDPPTADCDDRPVDGARLVVRDPSGAEVATAVSAADGTFRVLLEAGGYTLEPQPVEGLLGTAGTQDFTVDPAVDTRLDVSYDTGIR